MHTDYPRLFHSTKEANEFPPISIGELREEKEANELFKESQIPNSIKAK